MLSRGQGIYAKKTNLKPLQSESSPTVLFGYCRVLHSDVDWGVDVDM